MTGLIALTLCLCSSPCVISTNVADRWGYGHALVALDQRPGEFGFHTPEGAWHPIEFTQVPLGSRVRILGYDLDTVVQYTGRDAQRASYGWGLMALHTEAGGDVHITHPPAGRDVLKWAQMPISLERHTFRVDWNRSTIVNGVLPKNTLWIKHAMFNWTGREAQIETTGEFYFCYESTKSVHEPEAGQSAR